TTAVFDTLGEHTLRLEADDGERQVSDDVVITVAANGPPVVDAGPDQMVLAGRTMWLEGDATDDGLPTGVLQAAWTMVSGAGSPTFATPDALQSEVTFDSLGDYTLRLTVDDGEQQASDDLVVSVVENTAPTVDIGDTRYALPGESAQLSSQVEDDGFPDGVLGLRWSLVSGPGPVTFSAPDAAETLISPTAEGTYVVRLAVHDGSLAAFDDLQIIVAQNAAPGVSAGTDQTVVNNSSALLLGSVEDDGLPDGTLSLTWSQISGPVTVTLATPTQERTTVEFDTLGQYTFRLTANDGELEAFDEVEVSVVEPPSITLISPNGNETWYVGETEHVIWTAERVDDVTISLSVDNGVTWRTLIDSVDIDSPQWESYPLVVPDTPSVESLIGISGYVDREGLAQSAFPFTIATRPAKHPDKEGCSCSGRQGIALWAGPLLLWLRRRKQAGVA
ncbi:hypothetical protein ACFL6C_13800, partial [Myxococcota bacterium]